MDIGSISKVGNFINSYVEPSTNTPENQDHARIEPYYTENIETEKSYNKAELKKAVDDLNKLLQTEKTHLKFTMHEKLGEYYVQLVNDETNEVVREIPPRKILDMVADIQEKLGLLIDEKR
ncbi:flagellar protein FlaG [Brevibacillus sp. LEMMJ03]|jgi:flagellar protein FlaG|uniref:flagellar protein FlaG n=1 Tax=Brevibacillus sp. LEMMJ03 TaxID=2595056 RepID=UPI001181729C|nr:flagellar protein FlaG [Brevibacillus sp. LEMMJ03]TRY24506.1 flagellar protein FlaG [Brevibacillus sp. LEMMJ03]